MRVSHDAPTNPSRENLDYGRKETDFRFPLPLKGDQWKNCFDILLKEDKDRYEVWKDEIQNLLIFAGLFSAVVTAFAIDSYKSLQPDPSQTMIILLTQIASRLDNSNNTIAPTPITHFVPSSASVRINIYWFLSLLLSLTTVLVGIVTMQWLREYQRYKNNVTSKQAFALRNMRFESLKTWHVHHILTGLPLLLQAALLLFIIGIIEFLLDLSHPVAIPCIVIATFALFFHGYTTISPAFQYYWYQLESNSQGRDSTPIPPSCPYKSPQAWAFHSGTQVWGLSHIWRAVLNTLHNSYRFLRYIISFFHGTPKPLGSINWSLLSESTIGWAESRKLSLSSWNNIDLMWLRRRQPHESYNSDVARGLARTVTQHSHLEAIAYSSYYCFTEITSKDFGRQQTLDSMSPIIMDGDSSGVVSWMEPDGKGRHLSREEVLISFLDFLPQSSSKHPKHSLIWKHQTELFIQAYSPRSHLPLQHDTRELCPFLSGTFHLPRFIKELQYLKENVNQWDDALKAPLRELYKWLCQTNILDFGENDVRIQTFLEQFSSKLENAVLLERRSHTTHHGTFKEPEGKRSSQDSRRTSHAHFQLPPGHIEPLVPAEGTDEMGEREGGLEALGSQSAGPSKKKAAERFLSPYSQPFPDNPLPASLSTSTSTFSDVVNHGAVDMA